MTYVGTYVNLLVVNKNILSNIWNILFLAYICAVKYKNMTDNSSETLQIRVENYLKSEGRKKSWLKDYFGFSYQTLQNKLDGKTDWTKSELIILEQLLTKNPSVNG